MPLVPTRWTTSKAIFMASELAIKSICGALEVSSLQERLGLLTITELLMGPSNTRASGFLRDVGESLNIQASYLLEAEKRLGRHQLLVAIPPSSIL